MLNRSVAFVGVFILVLAAAAGGCGSQKAPAQTAGAAAETAFAAVQAEAVNYVPEQAKGVADAVAGAKAALGKGDYQAALAAAQTLPAKISELSRAVAAKKSELTAEWTNLSASMPKVVEVIQSRVGILSKSKALPAGLTEADIAAVWKLVSGFRGYAFCKAHSTAYGVEAYQSAWLKRYYPAEFMAAVLSNGKGFYHPLVYILLSSSAVSTGLVVSTSMRHRLLSQQKLFISPASWIMPEVKRYPTANSLR